MDLSVLQEQADPDDGDGLVDDDEADVGGEERLKRRRIAPHRGVPPEVRMPADSHAICTNSRLSSSGPGITTRRGATCLERLKLHLRDCGQAEVGQHEEGEHVASADARCPRTVLLAPAPVLPASVRGL